jgi:hypothetical protein
MSVAAANEWYHAELRVMSKRQRCSGRLQRQRPRCRGFESFGRFFIIIIFFCTLYNEKNYFFNTKHFLKFFLERNRLKVIVLLENIIEKEVTFFIIVFT